MFTRKHIRFPVFLLLVMLLATCASAKNITVDPTAEFCFSSEDFTTAESDQGIFLTSLPGSSVATVFHGDRVLRPGDALPLTTQKACPATS